MHKRGDFNFTNALVGGAIGGIGGGMTLGALADRETGRENETPEARRRRVRESQFLGLLLGSVAGAGVGGKLFPDMQKDPPTLKERAWENKGQIAMTPLGTILGLQLGGKGTEYTEKLFKGLGFNPVKSIRIGGGKPVQVASGPLRIANGIMLVGTTAATTWAANRVGALADEILAAKP